MTILSDVKNAVVYERINDGNLYGRTTAQMINLLKETNTDFIFRGFWRWEPVPESRASASTEITQLGGGKAELDFVLNSNYTYEDLRNTITSIKQQLPNILINIAIPAQKIRGIEKDDLTGEILGNDKTYLMALDPTKWGISITKDAAQTQLGSMLGWTPGIAYYPDITNTNYQTFLLDIAKKQIDSGADTIWIDMLFSQAGLLAKYTGDTNHPAVKESFESSSKLIDDIRTYGITIGKTILVGTWSDCIDLPYTQPKLDFVTISPKTSEIDNQNLVTTDWITEKNNIINKLGSIPIFTFIDWANDDSPIVSFSQKLNNQNQNNLLINMYDYFKNNGMIFAFPLHGGFMGNKATILSFGTQRVYDSLAPEFNTYPTIKQLMNDGGTVIPPITNVGWFRRKTCITPNVCVPNWGLVGIGGVLAYLILKK